MTLRKVTMPEHLCSLLEVRGSGVWFGNCEGSTRLLDQYLWGASHVPGTILGARDTVVNKIDKTGLDSRGGGQK